MNLKKSLIQIKMIELGIVPSLSGGKELSEMLKSLSDEDRVKAKRKFRKIWRKLAKREKDLAYSTGLGSDSPTKHNRSARLAYVVSDIAKDIKV